MKMRPPRLMWRRDGATRGFDLARREAAALGGLEAEVAERHVGAARGDAGVAALLFLAELAACGLQHVYSPLASPPAAGAAAALRTRLTAGLGASAPPASAGLSRRRPAQRRRAARDRHGRAAPPGRPGRHGRRAPPGAGRGADGGRRRPSGLARRRFAVAEPVAAVDPDLDADDAVGGLGFREAVVDVGLAACAAARDLRGTTRQRAISMPFRRPAT